MNKRVVEKYIPLAMNVIDKAIDNNNEKLINKASKKIKSEFNGYIASFGASVIQSGLVPTLTFFLNEKSSSNEDRKFVIVMLEKILYQDNQLDREKSLLEVACEKESTAIVESTINAAIALKLALRTYPINKEE